MNLMEEYSTTSKRVHDLRRELDAEVMRAVLRISSKLSGDIPIVKRVASFSGSGTFTYNVSVSDTCKKELPIFKKIFVIKQEQADSYHLQITPDTYERLLELSEMESTELQVLNRL